MDGNIQIIFPFLNFTYKNGRMRIHNHLSVEKVRLSFNEYVEKASRRGMEEMGMDIPCVHTDADSKDTKRAYAEKINPAKEFLSDKKGESPSPTW